MALSQSLVDAHNSYQQAMLDNHDWFPSNTTKLLAFIHAYSLDLALKPQLISHGGSQAEELRWDVEVTREELIRLQRIYGRLAARANGKGGGFRQTQTSRPPARW